MRRRRLTYMSRCAAAQFDALHATLQQRGRLGETLPWVAMVTDDLCILRDSFPTKFADLPHPSEDIQSYWRIARDFPYEWKMLVRGLCAHRDDCAHDFPGSRAPAQPTSAFVHKCCECEKLFPSARQLATHCWSKHGARCNIRRYIGDISCCPICGTDFFSRARLVKHLLEKRVRSKNRGHSCRERFLQTAMEEVPPATLRSLESRDAAVARAARRDGHTNVIASRPCQRHAPSILKRPLAVIEQQPRKRLRTKTRPNEA